MPGFVSKLKRIGLDVLKGIEIVGKEISKFQEWSPLLNLLLPQTPRFIDAQGKINLALTDIQNIIHRVEATSAAAGGLTGVQKLELATSQITPLLTESGFLNPKLFADAATAQAKIQALIQAVVDIENAQKAE